MCTTTGPVKKKGGHGYGVLKSNPISCFNLSRYAAQHEMAMA